MQKVAAREILVTGVLAAAVTLACAIAFYGPEIAAGSHLFFTHDISHSDVWHLNLPMKHLYDQALGEGRLPLWSPELGTGFPLLAQGEVGALYPFNLLLYAALPLVPAFNWSVLLHAALAGAFTAMLARQIGAGRAGSLLAGVVFAFGGFFVVHVKHVAITATAVWAPLLLLLIERFARGGRAIHVGCVALVTGTMLLAGHPQIAYYALLVAAGWACVLAVLRARRPDADGTGRPGAVVFGGGLAYAVLLGVLLAAPQLLPTRELNAVGPRSGGLTLEEATEWSYQWPHLVMFVSPRAFGEPGALEKRPHLDATGRPVVHPTTGKPLERLEGFRQTEDGKALYWETMGYVGILPLLLAAVCVVLGRNRRTVVMLAGLLVVCLLLALGSNGGLFQLFWHVVPGFKYFRFQSRFLLFVDLSLALMAGVGWTMLATRLRRRTAPAVPSVAAAAVILVCFLDCLLALGKHNPTVAADRWLAPPPSAQRIEREEAGRNEPFRIAGNDRQRLVFKNAYFRARGWQGDLAPYEAARNVLGPNLSAIYGLDNLEIFYPLYPQWMGDATRLLSAPMDRRDPDPRARRQGSIHPGFASLFNVRYVLDAFDYPMPGTRLLESYPAGASYPAGVILEPPLPGQKPSEVRLLENRGVFPRAFVVAGARVVDDLVVAKDAIPGAVKAMIADDFDPRREVVIVRQPGASAPTGTPAGERLIAPVEVVNYAPQEVRLRVDAPQSCWLVLSDTYYPGWRATVNGVETAIHRANVAVRAVRLERGVADVVFTYAPTSFRWGLLVALLGAGLIATLPLQLRAARAGLYSAGVSSAKRRQ